MESQEKSRTATDLYSDLIILFNFCRLNILEESHNFLIRFLDRTLKVNREYYLSSFLTDQFTSSCWFLEGFFVVVFFLNSKNLKYLKNLQQSG